MRRALIILGLVALSGGSLATFSSAGFTDRTENPSNTFSAASNFCASAGQQPALTPNRDAYVDESSPTNNFGTAGSLRVTSRNSNRNQRTLVGFQLPALPSGCSVTSATLTLTATSSATGRTIQVFQISPSASWTEAGVTWNTAPATTGSAATAASSAAPTFNVTGLVQAMYVSANPSNGFLVRDQSESQAGGVTQVYRDRTAASGQPQLVVTIG
jgi:predicted extracellular nuclease